MVDFCHHYGIFENRPKLSKQILAQNIDYFRGENVGY
jgi:hypothetical protein